MHRIAYLAIATLLSAAFSGHAAAQAPAGPADGPGLTAADAIEVCRPQGQRAWLARLLCPDRSHATFSRIGNIGHRQPLPEDMPSGQVMALLERHMAYAPLEPDEVDHHMVDAYTVVCGSTETLVHLDMYHCDAAPPRTAPPGFTLLE